MMLALKKTWILIKNYWWFPIGLCSAIIWVCTRHNKNKDEVLKFFKAYKQKANEELTAAKNAHEEEKRINKVYNEALKKAAEEQKKNVKEIKKSHREELIKTAKKNRGDKDKMAKEIAERFGLKNGL
jgi:esterase/lipase